MSAQPGRTWVYARSVRGRFQRLHRFTGLGLQAIFFGVPWITLAGEPVVRIDIPGRRLHAAGAVFTAEDTIFLVLLGLGSAFALFFVTAVFGRLWCGWACPQTVFLEEWIRPLERWIEGERGVRMARDRGGWTLDWAWRKAAKWSAFAAVSGVVAMTFTSWFAGAAPLWTGRAGVDAYAITFALGAVMFLDFAWFREQFCSYLCPYARFQGALSDEGSLVVAYDERRGEPRGRARSGACADCGLCVVVCPQGIDIRDGYQLECTTCARCVDACEGFMAKSGKTSLIGYTSVRRVGLVRPRTVAYGALLTAVVTAFVALLVERSEVDATIGRAPGTLFVVDEDGWVRNTYLLKVTNKNHAERSFELTISGIPGATLIAPPLHVEADARVTVPVVVRVPPGSGTRTVPLCLTLTSEREHLTLDTTFATEG